jgi:hypothetical protein
MQIVCRPSFEKTQYKKRVGRVDQGVGPEFKPQYHKEKKKTKNLKPTVCIKWT